jgi:nuclear cap-binding protein subunit 1
MTVSSFSLKPFHSDSNSKLDIPFSHEGKEILSLLRKKSSEDTIQPIIDRIHTQALDMNQPDSLVLSTDAYVTAICYIGSKSLSHVLSSIERCKERLLALGPASPAARKQIIESVMEYWKDQPGIGVNIVDKLLNYTILSPGSVVGWALGKESVRLSEAFVFEMVSVTIGKVTGRVRQVVNAKNARGLLPEQKALLEETVERERKSMKELFQIMEDALVAWATDTKDQNIESGDLGGAEDAMIRQWGERWLRVFRRKFAVEEAWFLEAERERVDDVEVDGNANGDGDALMVDSDLFQGVE